jgi:AcrR family transcriptional regulator
MGKANVNDQPDMTTARRRPQHSDDKLLDAATAVFSRHGYEPATVAQIATEAGATKPTLYARYGSKADLYRSTLERERDVFLAQLFAAYDDARDRPVSEIVARAVHAWFAYADARPDGYRLLLADTPNEVSAQLQDAIRAAVIEQVTALIEGAMKRIEQSDRVRVRFISAMIVGACVDGARTLHAEPALTSQDAATLATAFVLGATAGINPRLLEV